MEKKGSIISSRKGQIVLIGIVAVLGVTLGGAALGLSDAQKSDAIDALQWLIGLMIGGHTLTDIATNAFSSRVRIASEHELSSIERERVRATSTDLNTTTEIEVKNGDV